MNLAPGISLYNQDRLDDGTFVDNFVARLDLVEVLLNVLRQAAAGGGSEHQVLIGTRGMGKTSLLRRLAIAIGRDDLLRERFVPLRFREEQYNVISLDAFWRNCGEALAEWCDANGHESTADELDRATESSAWRDADKAAEGFLHFCAGLGRRACLLIDNLDLILDGLKDQSWSLRHVLQRQSGPIVIGAATQLLRQGADRDEPFYEFFHPLLLEPLSEAELMRCMHALADRRGDAGAQVKAVLARAPERIRTLYALTGGNPRILSLIYQLLERAESDTIFGDLEALLDQVTPFYKARIEEYAGPQQRAIIDAIALNWDPITSSALGEVTGIEVTTISSQLAPLRRDGFIERVPTSGARDGYQLGERFLNIWYLMRHGTRKTKQRLRWLTIFLTKLFSAEELGQMASQARDKEKGGRWHPDFRDAVIEACGAIELHQGGLAVLPERDAGNTAGSNSMPEFNALDDRAYRSFKDGRYEETIAALEELILGLGTMGEPFQAHVARALVNKGVTLGQLGRGEEEIAAYDKVARQFGTAADPGLRDQVARALISKGDTLGQLGRSEEAITVYDEAAKQFGDSVEPALQTRVANALINKGFRLGQLGRGEEEIATYDEVEKQFGDAAEPVLRDRVAMALFNKGFRLGQLGRGEEAIIVYEQVANRFGDAAEPVLQEQVAKALVNKGFRLGQLGRSEEEIAAYDEVANRFGDAAEPVLQEQVAKALFNKGVTLGQIGRSEEEIAIYDEVAKQFGDAAEPILQVEVAGALFNKGVTLGQLGRSEEEIAAYDEVVARSGDSAEPVLQEQVAGALFNKAFRLDELGRSEEAIAVYDDVANRFGDAAEPVLQAQVADAVGNAGRILFHVFGDAERSESYYRKALSIRERPDDAPNLIWSLIAQHRNEEAEAARHELHEIAPEGLALIDAGIAIIRDNFGAATDHLGKALEKGLEPDTSIYFEDILWFIRIAADKGYGEKLIAWFSSSGNAERYAPIYGALVARVRGENFLLDLNPEVRATASDFYRVLSVTAEKEERISKGKRGKNRRGRRK